MIDGSMQPYALTLDKFLSHAAKWHPHVEVVTGRDGGRVDRIGYDELCRRARKVSVVLENFGVRVGDRVAVLAGIPRRTSKPGTASPPWARCAT